MARADKLKAEGVRQKEKHEAETKELWKTLKVASSDPSMGGEDQMRDGSLGGLFTTSRYSPGKKG